MQNNNTQHVVKRAPTMNSNVPLRWLTVVQMHCAGRSAQQIAYSTGYSLNSIYRIINHKDSIAVRQRIMEDVQKEFDALYKPVVDALRDGLDDPDPKIRALYTGQWLNASSKKKETQPQNIHLTAEDMVVQILNNNGNADGQPGG